MLYDLSKFCIKIGYVLIRVILLWLGWAFIVIGSAEIIYQLFTYSQMYQELQKDALKLLNLRLSDIRDGLIHIALGAIMVGVHKLLMKGDMQNVTSIKAKKDLGNWPPSI